MNVEILDRQNGSVYVSNKNLSTTTIPQVIAKRALLQGRVEYKLFQAEDGTLGIMIVPFKI